MQSNFFKLMLLLICTTGFSGYSQQIKIDKAQVFEVPELKIQQPAEPVVEEWKIYFLPKNLKIKRKEEHTKITEFDPQGRITSEISSDTYRSSETRYSYAGDILVRKETKITPNVEEIRKYNSENERTENRFKTMGISMTVVLNEDGNSVLYTAKADTRNRIVSYLHKRVNTTKQKVEFEDSYQISYAGDKISEINSSQVNYRFIYEKGRLAKKITKVPDDARRWVGKHDALRYHYDQKGNLTAIWEDNLDKEGKPFARGTYFRDSAVYDDKNRVIWHGNPRNYNTFAYDKNGNLTEKVKFVENVVTEKRTFAYNSENQISEFTEVRGLQKQPITLISKFNYRNGLLSEILRSSNLLPVTSKVLFEYDAQRNLVRRTVLVPKQQQDSSAPPDEYFQSEQTEYRYNSKTMTVLRKGISGDVYEFY